MNARQFSRNDFSAFVALIANNAKQRPMGHTYLMTSDVAWQFPGCGPKENIRLWADERGLLGYVWFQPSDTIKFDVRADLEDYTEVFEQMMDWVLQRRSELPPSDYPFYVNLTSMDEWAEAVRALSSGATSQRGLPEPAAEQAPQARYLVTSALQTDKRRMRLLEAQGFTVTQHFAPILTCDLREVKIPEIPRSFTVRHVQEAELAERVALHRAAWAPASGFSLDQYQKVRAISEVFDPELDLVAVDNDGNFASYSIAWLDPVSGIGSFEPFGTHPDYRGTGVSRAVIGEGFRRFIAKGMQHARIYTAGFNQQAAKLYESCGFVQVDVNRTFIKET